MDIKKSTSITKFVVKDKTLFVKVLWKHNHHDLFHIKIFDGDVSWSGKFTNELAKKYRERFEEIEEQYIKQVKKTLKGRDHSGFTYDFTINPDNNDSATFTWKKKFEDSMHGLATLVHGSVPVHRDTTKESKDLLLDFLIEENQELRSVIHDLNENNEAISNDLKKCKAELEKFVDIKSSLETSLYGKFVQLLNAKKRRIQVMEGSLQKISKVSASE
ncbi:hypothetical protein HW555_004094 [Spodoptera exigua]|uniref:DNA repair protein XRCC4 n=1 Tax=Spodoptera exigua TaxID=7107 RepID=A0A835GLP5_SPOEX|nr:hypothetical protein HW555_004094 [Spodoptera exigua]